MFSLLIIANIFYGLILNIQQVTGLSEKVNLLPSKKTKHQEYFYQVSTQGLEGSAYSILLVEEILEEEEKQNKNTKKTSDNYFTSSTPYQNLKIDLIEESKISFCFTISYLQQIPFYMLYHCWKAFLIFK